jgi:hypothetical protein
MAPQRRVPTAPWSNSALLESGISTWPPQAEGFPSNARREHPDSPVYIAAEMPAANSPTRYFRQAEASLLILFANWRI